MGMTSPPVVYCSGRRPVSLTADPCSPPMQGDNDIDEDDVMDLLLDQQSKVASAALPRGGALSAVRSAKSGSPRGSAPGGVRGGLGAFTDRLLGKSGRVTPAGPVAEGVQALDRSQQQLSGVFSPIRKASGGGAKAAFDPKEMEDQVGF